MPKNLIPEDRWETDFQVPVPGEPRRIGPLETLFQKLLNRTERLKGRIAAILGAAWDAVPPDTLTGLAGRVSSLETSQGGTTLSAHRTAATLDHPDGSVTSEKIADGAVTPSKLAPGAVIANLGYTPVNRAGDTIDGNLNIRGLINIGGFDLQLGTADQSTRGNTGLSRALVKYNNATLIINYAGDFSGGVQVDGPGLTVTGDLTVNGVINGDITANRLAPGATPYDLALFYPGTPSAGALLAAITIPRNLSLQGGSVRVGTAPAANWTATIYHEGMAIGTVSVLAGQTTGTVTLDTTPTSLSAGALLRIVGPSTADSAIRDISISFQGVV
jgi:cytoskeletal protein CcmA (bactofilin family)